MTQILQKLICSFSIFTAILLTSYISAQNYTLQFNIAAFNGLTINSPSTIHENPNNSLHSQTALLQITPAVSEDVIITVTTNTAQCTVSDSPLILHGITTPGILSGTVTFTAVNDGIEEPFGNTCDVTYSLTSANPIYNNTTATATITIIDWNPTVIIDNIEQVNEDPLSLKHSHQIRVRLTDQPSANVVLNLSYDQAQLEVSPLTLVFDSNNWDTGLLVTTTAVYDKIEEPTPHFSDIRFTATSTSAVEFANKSWIATIPIADYTVTVPTIVRTGATQILPVLAFISFILLLTYFFASSNREEKSLQAAPTTKTII